MRTCVSCKWCQPGETLEAELKCVNPWMLKRWRDQVTGAAPTARAMREGHRHTACAVEAQYWEKNPYDAQQVT